MFVRDTLKINTTGLEPKTSHPFFFASDLPGIDDISGLAPASIPGDKRNHVRGVSTLLQSIYSRGLELWVLRTQEARVLCALQPRKDRSQQENLS